MSQQPVAKEVVYNIEAPKTVESVGAYYKKVPSWRFSRADTDHPRWSVKEPHEYVFTDPDDPTGTRVDHTFSLSLDNDLIESLKDRETTTWSELLTQNGGRGRSGGTNSHMIPIHKLTKEAQERATELNIIEDELLSLRITATKRVFGVLEDGALSVVWYDRNHEICPVASR